MRDFFDAPEQERRPSESRQKEEAQPKDTRPCRRCQAFTLNQVREPGMIGAASTVEGFGRCTELPSWKFPSPSFPCHFTPSRFRERP